MRSSVAPLLVVYSAVLFSLRQPVVLFVVVVVVVAETDTAEDAVDLIAARDEKPEDDAQERKTESGTAED